MQSHDNGTETEPNQILQSTHDSSRVHASTVEILPFPPPWPPSLPEELQERLTLKASDWAHGHGLVWRPLPPSKASPTPFHSSVHAPFTLLPTPFPAHLFWKAKEIQTLYNALYAKVASDTEFLERVIGQEVIKVDEFQRGLYNIWTRVRQEGIKQPLALGLFRSDYLLHSEQGQPLKIHQVEFNTISSSFGGLSSRVTALHKYLLSSPPLSEYFDSSRNTLPENTAAESLAEGLKAAHTAYNKANSTILFVVQPGERNAFDQLSLEWHLKEKYDINVLRLTHLEVAALATLGEDSELIISPQGSLDSPIEISTVYFRSGYTPNDYPTEVEWNARLTIEKSQAIKCPSIALQLAGAKKVQQILANSNELERFIKSEAVIAELRSTFAGLYPMNEDTITMIKANPNKYVLKPQREGGGNNIYRQDILPFLDQLSVEARQGYILMDLIQPPTEKLGNYVVAAGTAKLSKVEDIVSELGIYGITLFDQRNGNCTVNSIGGHLLRTKGRDVSEGGVATGYSVLDSPYLGQMKKDQ